MEKTLFVVNSLLFLFLFATWNQSNVVNIIMNAVFLIMALANILAALFAFGAIVAV